MIKIKNGDILNCKEDMIVHQVNPFGSMGGGLALQLSNRYTRLEKDYARLCKENNNDYEELKGLAFIKKYKNKYIANIFSQNPNWETDYKAMEKCFNWVKIKAKENNLNIAIPYKIGCGIAKGNWEIVYSIIEKVFKDMDITIYRLEI